MPSCSSFFVVAIGRRSDEVESRIRVVSSSENVLLPSTQSRKGVSSGHALWQRRHPTRQLCQEGSIQAGNSPSRSL